MSTLPTLAFLICASGLALFSPLFLIPAFSLQSALFNAIGPSSPWVLAGLVVFGGIVAFIPGLFAYAVASGNLMPLPTTRHFRLAAAKTLADATNPPRPVTESSVA